MSNLYLFVLSIFLLSIFGCTRQGSGNEKELKDTTGKGKYSEIIDITEKQNIYVDKEQADFEAFIEKFKKVSLPYEENPTGNEKFNKISLDEQAKYLSKAEKLSKKDFEDMADYTDFYFISNPVNSSNFHAIVYGRFEMGSTYYFLCTYNNQGKLLSNIDFAAYEMIGSGPQAGQEYNTQGKIDKNFEITVTSAEETRKYKIKDNGIIEKL
jgi:biopolymer transport protein ExbD